MPKGDGKSSRVSPHSSFYRSYQGNWRETLQIFNLHRIFILWVDIDMKNLKTFLHSTKSQSSPLIWRPFHRSLSQSLDQTVETRQCWSNRNQDYLTAEPRMFSETYFCILLGCNTRKVRQPFFSCFKLDQPKPCTGSTCPTRVFLDPVVVVGFSAFWAKANSPFFSDFSSSHVASLNNSWVIPMTRQHNFLNL